VLIDSTTALFYRDKELVNGNEYCYYLLAHGKYSIPEMPDPLINYSQLTCAVPVDNIPPCQPQLWVDTDCEQVSNEVKLYLPYDSCSYDAIKYFVYYTPPSSETPLLVDSVDCIFQDTSYFLHANLDYVVGCYYATAIDSVGNRSAPSEVVCVGYDACPVYEIPNVFSPNGDEYNNLLVPLSIRSANPKANVDRIDMTIFNRWGKIMFTTNDPEINWDGKNQSNNQDCEEGVYYYVCDVYIITLDGEQVIPMQGSVTIVR
jgi:gliding motility-associated-like protein